MVKSIVILSLILTSQVVFGADEAGHNMAATAEESSGQTTAANAEGCPPHVKVSLMLEDNTRVDGKAAPGKSESGSAKNEIEIRLPSQVDENPTMVATYSDPFGRPCGY